LVGDRLRLLQRVLVGRVLPFVHSFVVENGDVSASARRAAHRQEINRCAKFFVSGNLNEKQIRPFAGGCHGLRNGGRRRLQRGTDCGTIGAMSTTITLGKAGRLVVPKSVRERLHLREGAKLRLEVVADRLEMTPEVEEVAIEMRGKRRVVVGWEGFDAVKAVEATREERLDGLTTPGET
jgi:AbrB family looped-hinge helix DNA binding protein